MPKLTTWKNKTLPISGELNAQKHGLTLFPTAYFNQDEIIKKVQEIIENESRINDAKSLKEKQNPSHQPKIEKSCDLCTERFTVNSDFEIQTSSQHEAKKQNDCNVCGKTFLLKWRL